MLQCADFLGTIFRERDNFSGENLPKGSFLGVLFWWNFSRGIFFFKEGGGGFPFPFPHQILFKSSFLN